MILKNFKKSCFYWKSFYFLSKKNVTFFSFKKIKNFFLPKKQIKLKFFKIFKKTQQNFFFQIQFQGFKFKPLLIGKDIREKKRKTQKGLIKRIHQQKIEEEEDFFLTEDFKFKKFFILLRIKEKKICTSLKNFYTKNLFEETKNDIKLFLNVDLIKSALNRKPNLGCGWLFYDKTSKKKENFWFSYFSSCFNTMTQYQTTNEKHNFKKEIKNSFFSKIAKKKDFEFFHTSKSNENKIPFNNFNDIEDKFVVLEKTNLGNFLDSKTKKNFFGWRNRSYQRTFLNFFVFKDPIIIQFEPRFYFG